MKLSHLLLAAPDAVSRQADEINKLLHVIALAPDRYSTEYGKLAGEIIIKFNCLQFEMRMDLQRLPRKREYRRYIRRVYREQPARTTSPLEEGG